jgi:arabinose-5-phosphate isomerase
MLEKNIPLDSVTAREIMTLDPKTISASALAVEALDRLRKFDINQLVVVADDSVYLGFIHLHDLIREGLI